MASISVRQLDPDTVAALRQRAAAHGVSMEEEIRRILNASVSVAADERVGNRAEEIFRATWTGERFEVPPIPAQRAAPSFDAE
jgi:antitoxin FitA